MATALDMVLEHHVSRGLVFRPSCLFTLVYYVFPTESCLCWRLFDVVNVL